ncbi:HigA family addiction module antitoxin [Rhizobium sp. SL86]|jgi:addiction module HigA family antidote|uniref:HigA family addiction module antitoxin n=1 Tax=Rhizobium sp. SL86 TaxID=2995148 RepID=UPI002273636E|nr:HigA family addiction module antitoxin [Rhizobium sp. SL86]MCY1665631.1 HigA family addiction module antitoxin [Rhizobium sp. SL86]
MTLSKAPAIHPGEILRDLYLEPLGMSPYALAKTLRVPRTRIERIVAEKIGISADTALRLAKFFRTTPELWLNLQSTYDLKKQSAELGPELAQIPELGEAA